jgi:hypothetical protein
VANAITENPPRPLSVLRPDVDPRLSAIVDRAMTRDAHQRFRSAEVMRAELADLTGDPVTGPIPILRMPLPPAPPMWNPRTAPVPILGRRRRTGRLVLLAALLLVALVVGVVAFALGASTQRSSGGTAPATTTVLPDSPYRRGG